MWNAFKEGKDQINTVEMTNVFGPTTDHVTRDKVIVDAVLLGWSIVTAGMWNKCTLASLVLPRAKN